MNYLERLLRRASREYKNDHVLFDNNLLEESSDELADCTEINNKPDIAEITENKITSIKNVNIIKNDNDKHSAELTGNTVNNLISHNENNTLVNGLKIEKVKEKEKKYKNYLRSEVDESSKYLNDNKINLIDERIKAYVESEIEPINTSPQQKHYVSEKMVNEEVNDILLYGKQKNKIIHKILPSQEEYQYTENKINKHEAKSTKNIIEEEIERVLKQKDTTKETEKLIKPQSTKVIVVNNQATKKTIEKEQGGCAPHIGIGQL